MKEIELTLGYYTLVDDWNFDWLNQFNWYACESKGNVYAVRTENGKNVWMHREIMHTPDELEVDHKDWNGINNQEYNLRNCTHAENARNAKGVDYKGVSWNKRDERFSSSIIYYSKRVHLGNYKNEIDALIAYNKASVLLFGINAFQNKV